jgi:hypothetical protein
VNTDSPGKRERSDATPFDDLNQLLVELVAGAKEVLGDSFCGAYLQGSFAVGDADAHSDVDFIVVTKDDVTPEQQAELQALHQTLYALPTSWAQHLEGSYIPRKVLRRLDPERRRLLYLDNGATEFTLDSHDNTAVVRWLLRERGIVLAGPDPRELVDPITADDLRAEMHWALGLWQTWFQTVGSINRRGLAVAVLSHARMLHTLAIGEVSSKRAAGEWALHALGPEWVPLIRWALEDRPDPWTKVREPADPALLRRCSMDCRTLTLAWANVLSSEQPREVGPIAMPPGTEFFEAARLPDRAGLSRILAVVGKTRPERASCAAALAFANFVHNGSTSKNAA